jgi:PKD repeat protein
MTCRSVLGGLAVLAVLAFWPAAAQADVFASTWEGEDETTAQLDAPHTIYRVSAGVTTPVLTVPGLPGGVRYSQGRVYVLWENFSPDGSVGYFVGWADPDGANAVPFGLWIGTQGVVGFDVHNGIVYWTYNSPQDDLNFPFNTPGGPTSILGSVHIDGTGWNSDMATFDGLAGHVLADDTGLYVGYAVEPALPTSPQATYTTYLAVLVRTALDGSDATFVLRSPDDYSVYGNIAEVGNKLLWAQDLGARSPGIYATAINISDLTGRFERTLYAPPTAYDPISFMTVGGFTEGGGNVYFENGFPTNYFTVVNVATGDVWNETFGPQVIGPVMSADDFNPLARQPLVQAKPVTEALQGAANNSVEVTVRCRRWPCTAVIRLGPNGVYGHKTARVSSVATIITVPLSAAVRHLLSTGGHARLGVFVTVKGSPNPPVQHLLLAPPSALGATCPRVAASGGTLAIGGLLSAVALRKAHTARRVGLSSQRITATLQAPSDQVLQQPITTGARGRFGLSLPVVGPGLYRVTLHFGGNSTHEGSTTSCWAFVPQKAVPADASFSATPSTTSTGEPVTFAWMGRPDPTDPVVTYDWDFGDGSTGTGASTSHSYSKAGTYTVRLTATNKGDAISTSSQAVRVNAPPVAQLTITPAGPSAGAPVSFDGTSSTDSDDSITSFAWNFGDGATAATSVASHTYASAGSYTVTLTVTDQTGLAKTKTQTVAVGPPLPDLAIKSIDRLATATTTCTIYYTLENLGAASAGASMTHVSVAYSAGGTAGADVSSGSLAAGAARQEYATLSGSGSCHGQWTIAANSTGSVQESDAGNDSNNTLSQPF